MNKKIISAAISVILVFACTANALAFDVPEYRFDGAPNDELYDNSGVATAETGVQVVLPDDTRDSVLPYGVEIIGPSYAGSNGGLPSYGTTAIAADGYPDVWAGQAAASQESFTAYMQPDADVTQSALQQKDGCIGVLSISSIKMSAKLYENDMSKGVGHIPGTAFWNGNVGIMGHNRGSNAQFAKLTNLNVGDVLTYTTNQGMRTYVVTYNGIISSTDWSLLQPTPDNRITLITCIANQPNVRVCVQAVEVR